MKKFQLFLVVESLLLTMAFLTILASDFSAAVCILVMVLLVLRFYNLGSRSNFLLTAGLLLLFLIFMLNPYVIAAILFAVAYILINHFSQVKQNNRRALIQFEKDELDVRPKRNKWIGSKQHLISDDYCFDDINIIRVTGSDTIDLSQVIIKGKDNVIVIRKVYGPTQILVPLDVTVKLDVSAVYGNVTYFDFPAYDLRNESIKLSQPADQDLLKSVKLIVSVIAGSVEVKRL
ncbi:cell wall-active antibiotics response protein LiaF [Streptococcus sp. sy018]|uniref:cell wall-active antibiotics response protein LiaF n=1 Tax=Streptococcus sp. sy018 TaxID=2600147 RepID=UPI0011B6683F|nr:cell wall-active antibiotics response protein LiaF [Streptococcus sp. sy018]TWS94400.1 transporter [Streptococcus sp. sy018]